LEWDQLKVHDYIYDNNYPMLRRALDDGFDHNFVLPNRGSLLGLSVVAGCYRCVKMLVERGADVNTPILMEEVIKVKGWNDITSIKDWTPLMMAVADGNVRIVQELIESGSALVSKTGNGKEGPRFHARAVARNIKDEELRKAILNSLYLNDRELINLMENIQGFDFFEAINTENMSLIDNFLLLNTNLNSLPTDISLDSKLYNEEISDLLSSEYIIVKFENELIK
jgi:ankyrin repeat protein